MHQRFHVLLTDGANNPNCIKARRFFAFRQIHDDTLPTAILCNIAQYIQRVQMRNRFWSRSVKSPILTIEQLCSDIIKFS